MSGLTDIKLFIVSFFVQEQAACPVVAVAAAAAAAARVRCR